MIWFSSRIVPTSGGLRGSGSTEYEPVSHLTSRRCSP